METKGTQITFGICRVCKINEAVYSRGVCRDCEDKKHKIALKLNEQGFEAGTEKFIDGLKEAGVYY